MLTDSYIKEWVNNNEICGNGNPILLAIRQTRKILDKRSLLEIHNMLLNYSTTV
jgi:hypothetical protein